LSKIPTSLLKRGSKLIGLASKVALEEVSSRLKTWENEKEKLLSKIELTQDIVKTLSELKGASMKLGQLLSLDLGDYLPPELVKILGDLHQKSSFLPFETINNILKQELGEKYQHLTNISQIPIAAASIGQVHKATLGDKEIVIKIQYPGIAESIPSDMRILEIILKQLLIITRKTKTDLSPVLEEIKEVLLREVDYKNEIQMHQRYRKAFQKKEFIIPEPFHEYSSGKILSQEFIEGLSITDWIKQSPSYEDRHRIADLLVKLYLEEIFIHHIVQTDPNPGNFLMTPDNQMVLIDFGAVKEYDTSFVEGYRKILIASHEKDANMILSESYKVNFIDERESNEAKQIYLEMMDYLSEPFRTESFFDFSDKDFFTQSRDLSIKMSMKCRYSPPPKDLIFLHRKLAGIFIFLKKLDVKIRLKDYWHYVEGASIPE
jgi:aarF domain-containing kinase